jgi:uncharacterized protein YndB with AHSA1/START domain
MSETQTPATTIAPIRRAVVVEVGQERAFEVFTAEMTSWWPAEHHIGSAPIEEEVIEPRVGGRWFTRHQDGTETSTGVVTAWEPPGRLVLTWQIGADWQFHDDRDAVNDHPLQQVRRLGVALLAPQGRTRGVGRLQGGA